jgi:hypothetical protein
VPTGRSRSKQPPEDDFNAQIANSLRSLDSEFQQANPIQSKANHLFFVFEHLLWMVLVLESLLLLLVTVTVS